MFHMLSAVTLQSSTSSQRFGDAVDALSEYLSQEKLIAKASPLGTRHRHPIMDTDDADLDFFFTMSFDSREQLEAAVNYMTRRSGRGAELHEKLWSELKDYRFTCWED